MKLSAPSVQGTVVLSTFQVLFKFSSDLLEFGFATSVGERVIESAMKSMFSRNVGILIHSEEFSLATGV